MRFPCSFEYILLLTGVCLTGFVRSTNDIEDTCLRSDKVTCAREWRQEHAKDADGNGGRHFEARDLPDSPVCSGKSAILLLANSYGPWGHGSELRNQIQAVFSSFSESHYYQNPTYDTLKNFDAIVVEGGAEDWDDMSRWLDNGGRQVLEQLATEGHTLLVNAAGWSDYLPNVISGPFGVELVNPNGVAYDSSVVVTNTDILQTPFDLRFYQYSFTGNFFSHGAVNTDSSPFPFIPLIMGFSGRTILARGHFGAAANVFVGAMTTTNWHSPSNPAYKLRLNILSQLCAPGLDDPRSADITAKCKNAIVVASTKHCRGQIHPELVDDGSTGDIIFRAVHPERNIPLGKHDVTLVVFDRDLNQDYCRAVVTVVDQSRPKLWCVVLAEPVPIRHTFDSIVDTVEDACDHNPRVIQMPRSSPKAGMIKVIAKAIDKAGNKASCTSFVPVYDPNACQFVDGAGCFYSEKGSFLQNPDSKGKATFRFQSGYNAPRNNTHTSPFGTFEFELLDEKYGGLKFVGRKRQNWLVLPAKNRKCFKFMGVGKLNGKGGFMYMLTACDFCFSTNCVARKKDTIRVQIADYDGNIVYDSKMGKAMFGSFVGSKLGYGDSPGGYIHIHRHQRGGN